MERSIVGLALVPDCGLGPVRSDVREQLARWGRSALADDCLLVVSELLANAYGHGTAPVRLSLALRGQAGGRVVRVQVSDMGPGFDIELVSARWRHPSFVLSQGGRGLLLVDALCRAWGERHGRRGHTVWADLPRGIG
ncbi:ATP-binding protein [Streptomyces prunicolor]|uniref:ATP-binding protein n=1 Tax=Streptomyces prunicolor TaxID=67348 RepID=UPI003867D192|nr:ATP-binding protein [Streptomyces prunicolor]